MNEPGARGPAGSPGATPTFSRCRAAPRSLGSPPPAPAHRGASDCSGSLCRFGNGAWRLACIKSARRAWENSPALPRNLSGALQKVEESSRSSQARKILGGKREEERRRLHGFGFSCLCFKCTIFVHALTGVQRSWRAAQSSSQLARPDPTRLRSASRMILPLPNQTRHKHIETIYISRYRSAFLLQRGVGFGVIIFFYLCLGLLAILALVTGGKAQSGWADGGGEGAVCRWKWSPALLAS